MIRSTEFILGICLCIVFLASSLTTLREIRHFKRSSLRRHLLAMAFGTLAIAALAFYISIRIYWSTK